MRQSLASVVAVSLLAGCGPSYTSEPPPSEAEVKAKFFELVLVDEELKSRVDMTSVRIINQPESVNNDFMDGHYGVGHRWCMLVSPKQVDMAEKLAEGLLRLSIRHSTMTEEKRQTITQLASQWRSTGAFLVSVTHKLGSNWNKDDPWTFTWNSSANVC